MAYIKRCIEEKIKSLLTQFSAVALTGPRQSGKSTVLKHTFPNYKYVTFDDPLTRERALTDPQLFLDELGERVILDEIQYVPQIISYVKIIIDKNREKKGLYIFTGSQQFLMIKQLSDSLAGRIVLLELLPFSILEKKEKINSRTTLDYFFKACLIGSYPELVTNNFNDLSLWYGSYIQTYLERDIKGLYNIGELRDFQNFLRLLAARCAQILNISRIAGEIGVSVPTLKRWISILEAGRIIYLLAPYYNNFGKRIIKAPKVYFLDCGLVCYLTGIKTKEALLQGPLAGALFENFCIQEIIKLFFNSGQRAPIYYFRSSNDLEIDIIVEENYQTVVPIEIKLSKTPRMAMANNIKRYKKLFPSFNIKDGVLLSLSEEEFKLSQDVKLQRLPRYLVETQKSMG